MNIALTCDHLLEKGGHYSEMIEFALETLGSMADSLEIYTLAYKPEAVSRKIKRYPIHSGFLSNMISTKEQLYRKSWIIPGAADCLKIPSHVDLIFSLSQGFAHGIPKPKQTRQIVYQYNRYIPRPRLSEKFFTLYLNSWPLKKLLLADDLWVSSPSLFSYYKNLYPHTQLVEPGFSVGHFPLFPTRPSSLGDDAYYAIGTDFLVPSILRPLLSFFQKAGLSYRFIEADGCPGETASVLGASSGLIQCSPLHPRDYGFPRLPMAALATGRPIVVQDLPINRELFGKLEGQGVLFIKSVEELSTALERLREWNVRPARLRALAMKYHDLRFKGKIRRELNNFIPS